MKYINHFLISLLIIASCFTHLKAQPEKLPIVYHPEYNGSMGTFFDWFGSLIHPFDKKKFEKIFDYLTNKVGLEPSQFFTPEKIKKKDLLLVHDHAYLRSLHSSLTLSRAIDLQEALSLLPSKLMYKGIVTPQKYATGGTVLAVELAMQKYGWAINIGGGYHHAKRGGGEGGCLLADIPLAVIKIREKLNRPDLKVLVIDLDAHQGNGLASYFKDDVNTFIFDMFNKNEYPKNADGTEQYIDFPCPLDGGMLLSKIGSLNVKAIDHFGVFQRCEGRRVSGQEYLTILKAKLPQALQELKNRLAFPDLIIFNAGTDPFEEDEWGCMNVSYEAMLERDRFVWQTAQAQNIPIVMVLSGGYSPQSVSLVSHSIEQVLKDRKLIA